MRRALAAGLVACLCLPALAHDMWLVPPGEAAVDRPVEVEVSVGMDFPTSLSSIDPARLVATSALGPGGESADVALRPDEDGATMWLGFTPRAPGAWLVATTTLPKVLELEGPAFDDYLLHDGMPHVLAGRMDRGELGRDAVELYSKSVKAVVSVGDAPDAGDAARAVLGHVLEIVPLSDPLAVDVGGTLAVRVLFRGEPLARANVCWDHPGNAEDFTGQTWTDADGVALVPIGATGPMTLRLVHMTRPMTDDHEWESFWASYTFRVTAGA